MSIDIFFFSLRADSRPCIVLNTTFILSTQILCSFYFIAVWRKHMDMEGFNFERKDA